ncbi:Transmembrane protein 62 [Quaeritorhiza haematococci]|nr:Transmembrane protein 62 [Quaeritorhiza haematococci]
MFASMSSVRKEGYAFHHRKPFGDYAFLALDGCPKYGASRPFNFFGTLDTEDMDFLHDELEKAATFNHTFVLSHYPTATTLFGHSSNGLTFTDLSSRVTAFLCGHLHRLILGLGHKLYAHQDMGFLELELGDMKQNALYRIMVVDHDLISFTDQALQLPELPLRTGLPTLATDTPQHLDHPKLKNQNPVIVITNPKDNRFLIPKHEPVGRIKTSTHIRILVWTNAEIKSIDIEIDGIRHREIVEFRGKGRPWLSFRDVEVGAEDGGDAHLPLWVSRWAPSDYDDGKEHVMVVHVRDVDGNEAYARSVFRVDGLRTTPLEAGAGEWIMSASFGSLVGEHAFFKR